LNRDMCKFESSQKDESRWQSTDSSKHTETLVLLSVTRKKSRQWSYSFRASLSPNEDAPPALTLACMSSYTQSS